MSKVSKVIGDVSFLEDIINPKPKEEGYKKQIFSEEELDDLEYTDEEQKQIVFEAIEAAYDRVWDSMNVLQEAFRSASIKFPDGEEHDEFYKLNLAILAGFNAQPFAEMRMKMFLFKKKLEEASNK